jgi:lipopolysaccharide/colanic/teichoic acid biosynthesis glycosyltransferase
MYEQTVYERTVAIPYARPRVARRGMAFDRILSRLSDIAIALIVLILALPLLIGVALAVKGQDGGPMIFAHERIGRNGRLFRCFKFRSMVLDADARLTAVLETDPEARAEWARDHKLRVDPRVTRVGDFLRRSSLDELPQLFNVLRGEMSIVGPRPPIASEVANYALEHFRRLEVMPGLTGLWQIQARHDSSFATYIALDTAYVENWSFWLDLKILVRTARVVIRGTGT